MDLDRFDSLTRTLTTSGTRRGLVRLLAILPLSGALGAFLGGESEAAKHHHHKRQQQDAAHGNQLHEERKKKHKKRCAHAGQRTSKQRKRCCGGLAKDASGVCVSPTPASPAPPSAGCTSATCGGNSICVSGTCQPCDVCPSGCLFTSVAQAVAAASAGETIRICSGLYRDDIVIDKSLTLIGAGDGNGAGSTILRGSGTRQVVDIRSVQAVALERLRITGGATDEFGAGIRNTAASLTLTGCTITGNKVTDVSGDGGGIANFNTRTVKLINSRVIGNTAAGRGGGIFNFFGNIVLDAASRITGNQASLTIADSGAGIYNNVGTVTLSSTDNVTGNTPDNCGGTAMPMCVG